MDASKFLDLVISEEKLSISNAIDMDRIINILKLVMDGIPLYTALTANNISYATFMNAIKSSDELYTVYQEAKKYSSDALKERLLSILFTSSTQGNTSDARWLLERLYPNEFGKQTKQIIQTEKAKHPEAIMEYINADYEEVDED